MSMYNMIHGVNETAPILLLAAGFRPEIVKHPGLRFRDCYCNEDGTEIILYTRIGGGNREAHADTIEKLRGRPNYIRDEDDSFDETFASFYFRPLVSEAAEIVAELHKRGLTGSERPTNARALMDDLQAGRETPAVAQAMKALKPVAESLKNVMDGKADSASVTDIEGAGVDILGPEAIRRMGDES